jgi:hypothetical protein
LARCRIDDRPLVFKPRPGAVVVYDDHTADDVIARCHVG